MTHRSLEFVVVGAQKAGTTALHHALEKAAGVCVPSSKEAPFFADEELYSRGTDWFYGSYFDHCPDDDRVFGTVTPQYMYVPRARQRLKAHNSSLVIMAILRDPIERARSHHAMNVRRGVDSRSLQVALEESLRDDEFGYLGRGRYGELCWPWIEDFGAERVTLLDYAWFRREPQRVVDAVCDAIGVQVDTRALGKTSNPTRRMWGTEPVKRALGARWLKGLRRRLPESTRKGVWLWFEQGFPVPWGRGVEASIEADLCDRLALWFEDDRLSALAAWSVCGRHAPPDWMSVMYGSSV